MKILNYGKQHLDHNDYLSIKKVLKSDIITRGKQTTTFEKKISKFVDSKYTIVCNSGSSAILMSLLALNVKKGDNIVMPSINFLASYNVAKFLEANIYLSDVDELTGQMTPLHVEECIKKNKIKKIKIIITQYHGGYPENVKEFFKLKKKLKCLIMEDACHAFGARYTLGKKKYFVGSCKHSDICTFSFHPLKTITTGEGGAITTNSKKLMNNIKLLRSNGIVKDKKFNWISKSNKLGFNFNLTDFQCALGISQLSKINKFINKREKIFKLYQKKLKNSKKFQLVDYKKDIYPSYHLFFIHLKTPSLNYKKKFFNFMKNNHINLMYHYIPIYKFKSFKGKFLKKNSDKYFLSSISLPIYYSLTKKEQLYIIEKIKDF
jgi:dTDP-4-amino-4,6-dideoxygalactose transaminase